MPYNYRVVYVTPEGRQKTVNCYESYNIALGIAKIQLGRGAQSAVVEVTIAPADQPKQN